MVKTGKISKIRCWKEMPVANDWYSFQHIKAYAEYDGCITTSICIMIDSETERIINIGVYNEDHAVDYLQEDHWHDLTLDIMPEFKVWLKDLVLKYNVFNDAFELETLETIYYATIGFLIDHLTK